MNFYSVWMRHLQCNLYPQKNRLTRPMNKRLTQSVTQIMRKSQTKEIKKKYIFYSYTLYK